MRKDSEEKIRKDVANVLGTAPGGITDTGDIKVLICYLLNNIRRPVTKAQLDEILSGSEMVNYFDYSQALGMLLESRDVFCEEGFYTVSERGAAYSDVLKSSLPFSVRDRVLARAFGLLRRIDVLAENDFTIEDCGGQTYLVCNIRDKNGALLMASKISVGSAELAATLGRQFMKDPQKLYTAVFAVLSGENN